MIINVKIGRFLEKIGIKRNEPHVLIGRHHYGIIPNKPILRASASNPVTIGSFCTIAAGVAIIAEAEHPTDLPSTFPFKTLMFNASAAASGLNNRSATGIGP